MNCIAITASGAQCSRHGSIFFEGNYCMTHFNKKQRDDPAFRTRYLANLELENAAIQQRRQEHMNLEAQRQAQAEAQRAQVAATEAARAQRRRDRKILKNAQLVENAHLQSPHEISSVTARNLITMWDTAILPGLEVPTAYACIKYKSSTHEGFPNLIRAVVQLVCQGLGNHPNHLRYTDVPLAERTPVLEALKQALVPYGEITNRMLLDMIHVSDAFRPIIRRNVAEIEHRIAQEVARAQAQAQLQQDLLHVPVVFQRDPEGSINLQAFAQDNQSVHRSSVQTATHRAAIALLERPVPAGQDTLPEIIADFNSSSIVRFTTVNGKERVVTEITNDYFNSEAFSVKYGDVLDRVWAYICAHTEKKELVIRLAQEVAEGYKMCTNGKMARLINVLQGYDETLEFAVPKELFQNQIALLMERPLEEREEAANQIFHEFQIPAAERAAWLTPLLEA